MNAFITGYRDRLQEARRAPDAPAHVYPALAAPAPAAPSAAPPAPVPAPAGGGIVQ